MKQTLRSAMLLSASALVLSGCASSPKEAADTTPRNPTIVLTADYTVNGIYVPNFTGKQTVYTREDMRRLDHRTRFDSFAMRWANSDTSDIFRIDQNLVWMLDNDKKTYRECPLAGCIQIPFLETLQVDDDEDEEAYLSYEERGCRVQLTSNDYKVESTGKTRRISGVPATEYVVSWQTELEDMQGRKDTNLLQFVFWVTEPTATMNRAWNVHTRVIENYVDAVGEDDVFVRLLGKDGYMAIAAFVGDIRQTDESAYAAWMNQLREIEGYPLSIKMEWFQDNKTCPSTRNRKSTSVDLSQGVDGVRTAATNMLSNFVSSRRDAVVEEWMKDVRVRYLYEVTSVSEEMIHDSRFTPPAAYKLVDRQ